MYNKYHVIVISKTHRILLATFFILLLTIVSCKKPASHTHAYFTTVFKYLDSSYNHKFYYSKEDMQYLDRAFDSIKAAGDEDIARKYLRKASYYQATNAEFDIALSYFDSTLKLLQNKLEDQQLAIIYSQTCFEKGNLFFKLKKYDEAVRNFTLGKMVLSKNLRDSCDLFGYYHSMAFTLYAQQKYLQAARFFHLKYLTAASCGKDPYIRFLDMQENLDNTGMGYFNAGLTDSAVYYYDATLKFINENEQNFPAAPPGDFEANRSVVYSNLAGVLYRQKDTAGAEKLFLQSIEGTKTLDAGFTRPLRLQLADLYIGSNQLQQGADLLQQISRSIDSSEVSTVAGDFNKLMAAYYIKTKLPLAANKSLQHAYYISDSLEKRDRKFNAIDVQREFENREQTDLNQSLKKDNDIKKGYLFTALVTACMAVIIILLVWYNLNRKSAFVKKLTFFNTEIGSKNEDLQKTFLSLEQSHRENTRILRVVAHDLKNPVSAIRTLVYSMLRKQQTTENKEALELIQGTCIESIGLINDLLQNKRSLKDISKELVDMGRLIEQCTELFLVKAEEKNQLIKLQLDHPIMMMNRQRIWRVVSNMVNNAIKFSPANAEIIVRLERKGESVLLSVQDNGIGIPVGIQEKIFTPGMVAQRAGTAGEESYGLGLSISRKIIEEHSGQLWFESEAGKGSIFYVELPYHVN